jgi:hypothetical protein
MSRAIGLRWAIATVPRADTFYWIEDTMRDPQYSLSQNRPEKVMIGDR